jgi:hypothetical protein
VEVVTGDGLRHRGAVVEVGDSWCLLEADGRVVLVPFGQVLTATGLSRTDLRPVRRPGMGSVLRRWGRTRCVVTLRLLDGSTLTGSVVDVFSDAFTLLSDDGPSRSLTIPTTAVRWLAGDAFMDEC